MDRENNHVAHKRKRNADTFLDSDNTPTYRVKAEDASPSTTAYFFPRDENENDGN